MEERMHVHFGTWSKSIIDANKQKHTIGFQICAHE